jgi:hypothetical protein
MQYFQTLELTPAYVGPIIPRDHEIRTTHWDFSNDSNQDHRDGFLPP